MTSFNSQKGSASTIALSIIAIVIIVAAIWYGMTRNSTINTSTNTETPTASTTIPDITATSTENASMTATTSPAQIQNKPKSPNAYSNKSYGYEVSYPAEWGVVRDLSTNNGNLIHTVFAIGNIVQNMTAESLVVEIHKNINAGQALQNILDLEKKRASTSTIEVKDITVAGVSAKFVSIKNPLMEKSTPNWNPRYIVLGRFGWAYVLGNGGIEKGLFEKFYQSFKFI